MMIALTQRPVGCVAVNPRNGTIMAAASDERCLSSDSQIQFPVVFSSVFVLLLTDTSGNPLRHACMICAETVSKNPASTEYICTGYDLITTEEPCVMFVNSFLFHSSPPVSNSCFLSMFAEQVFNGHSSLTVLESVLWCF